MAEVFSTPLSYNPPSNADLPGNIDYPNLNSKEYRIKKPSEDKIIQPFFEAAEINENGQVILVSNEYIGRIWNGSVWGFENFDDVGKLEKSVFNLPFPSNVTNLRYIEANMVIVTGNCGSIQLWSTKSEARQIDGYCLFLIGRRDEHVGSITDLDIFSSERTKSVTVSSDACIKIWNMGGADLTSINTMRNTHADNISGVSTSHSLENTFATCSRDKTALLWDTREIRPATSLFDNHSCPFTSIYWTSAEENDNMVILGDESGKIHVIDPRVPDIFMKTIEVFDRRINKIKFNGNKFAVSGNTNNFKLFDASEDYSMIFEDSTAGNYVRNFTWVPGTDNQFYAIGWDKYFEKYSF